MMLMNTGPGSVKEIKLWLVVSCLLVTLVVVETKMKIKKKEEDRRNHT